MDPWLKGKKIKIMMGHIQKQKCKEYSGTDEKGNCKEYYGIKGVFIDII